MKNLKINCNRCWEKLYPMEKRKDIILIGGYKGLLHSILLKTEKQKKKRQEKREMGRGIFLDCETDLPARTCKYEMRE